MVADLLLALPLIALVYVLPGWFWSGLLVPSTDGKADLAERLAYSTALSLALVPAVALVPARLFGLGVTLPVVVAAPLLVLGTGALLYRRFGGGAVGGFEKHAAHVAGTPIPPNALALVPVGLALVLVLIPDLQNPEALGLSVACEGWRTDICVASGAVQRFTLPTAILLALAGAVYALTARRGDAEPAARVSEEPAERQGPGPRVLRLLFLGVVAAVLVRGYWGVVAHDWPFIRGLDHYSHAVMANMILAPGGSSESYLIYPPGFHTMTAILSRLTTLDPLEIFSVAGPLVLLLPTLSLYALAKRLWGRSHGVAAAALAGVFMGGAYYFFNDAMYPNMTASQFLFVLAISALVGLYASPSWRSVALLVLVGASVFLYHPVASSYMALLMAFVSVAILPYLLLRDRSRGVPLFLAFALLTALATLYAWDTYDVGRVISNRLGGSEAGTTATAVGQAVGTQIPYEPGLLIASIVSQPVFWLGTLGAVLLLADLRGWRADVPTTLARVTVLGWAAIIFLGSRTTFTGFPQRFGRDLGAPLSLLGAVAVVAVLAALLRQRRALSALAVSAVVVLGVGLLGIRAVQSYAQATSPSPHLTIDQPVAEAGAWLEEHNRGGNIMVSPERNQVPSRMMLAMGDYSALQSFTPLQIANPRDLPPYGPGPLRDVLYVMENPGGERVEGLLREHDVDYVVVYKRMPDRPTVGYARNFEENADLWETVFENESVLILTRR